MSADFNIKPAGVPAVAPFVRPRPDAATAAVPTQLPSPQAITAGDTAGIVRNNPPPIAPPISRQVVFDHDAESMVYQSVDSRTGIVVRQFPDQAMLRRRAYFHQLDLLKEDAARLSVTDRRA